MAAILKYAREGRYPEYYGDRVSLLKSTGTDTDLLLTLVSNEFIL